MPPRKPSIFTLGGLISGLIDLGIGGVFLVTWLHPYYFKPRMVHDLPIVMLLEFVIIHSTWFLLSILQQPKPVLVRLLTAVFVALSYTLVFAAFSSGTENWWQLTAFWGLTLNRLIDGFLRRADGAERAATMRAWAASMVFYLGFAFLTLLIPMPAFGVTPEVIEAQRLSARGIWVEEPYRAIALGFLYFTALGLSGLFGHAWVKSAPSADSLTIEKTD